MAGILALIGIVGIDLGIRILKKRHDLGSVLVGFFFTWVVIAILVFIFAWNEFLLALTFMTHSATRTVPVGIAMLSGVSAYEIPWDQIAAAVVATTLPLVLVVLIFQKRIIQGLTAGAVKG